MASVTVYFEVSTTLSIDVEIDDLDPESLDPEELAEQAMQIGAPSLCHYCASRYSLGDPNPMEISGLDGEYTRTYDVDRGEWYDSSLPRELRS